MSDTAIQAMERRQANLMALHRQLQEMAVRINGSAPPRIDQSRSVHGPILVIRGK